jgi:hypothetical protein
VCCYDRATGRLLWTLPEEEGERLNFAGGYLISAVGNRITSVG